MTKTPTTDGTPVQCPRSTNGFQEPDLDWLEAQFKTVRIGAMKASELEIILAYQLFWKAGDLTKSPYDIARKYGYTESKATRLLQEFSYRFHDNEDDSAFLARLWNCITGKNTNETNNAMVPVVQDTDILLSIQSPYDRNRLRYIVETEGLPWMGDFNKKLVRMPLLIFAYIFRNHNPGFNEVINKARTQLQTELKAGKLSSFAIYSHLKKNGSIYLSLVKTILERIMPYLL